MLHMACAGRCRGANSECDMRNRSFIPNTHTARKWGSPHRRRFPATATVGFGLGHPTQHDLTGATAVHRNTALPLEQAQQGVHLIQGERATEAARTKLRIGQ